MADSGAFINVLNQEDYETREHCIENCNLLIEEPTERSQKFKRNIGVRHQEDKHQALRDSLCKILISSFAHKMDFANNFSVDFF